MMLKISYNRSVILVITLCIQILESFRDFLKFCFNLNNLQKENINYCVSRQQWLKWMTMCLQATNKTFANKSWQIQKKVLKVDSL